MTKSAKLKAHLKAASRRRKRRGTVGKTADHGQPSAKQSGGTPNGQATPEGAQVDIAGLLIDAALRAVNRHREVRDPAVYGALKCVATGSEPSRETTRRVLDEINTALSRVDVPEKSLRQAAEELCAIARPNLDPDQPDRLIQYLTLISN